MRLLKNLSVSKTVSNTRVKKMNDKNSYSSFNSTRGYVPLIVDVIVVLIVSLCITMVYERYVLYEFMTKTTVVLDKSMLSVKAVELYGAQGADAAITRAITRIEEMKNKGTIVLDRQAVLTAPDSVYLDEEALLKPL